MLVSPIFNAQVIMSDKPHVSLQTILHSLEMIVPKSIVHRVKKLYRAMMESIVSVLHGEKKYICQCVFIWQ